MRRRLAVLGLVVPLLWVLACKKEVPIGSGGIAAMPSEAAPPTAERAQANAAPESPPAAAEEGEKAAAPAPRPTPRKLIRKVELDLEVRDTEATARQVKEMAEKMGGFVSDVNARRAGELMHYSLTLRIPAEKLDEALAVIRKLADRVDREQQGVEDVTSQYVDLDARLRTLKSTEAELRALLAESRSKARKVDEIMSVYRELVEIRSQIEQIEAQVRTFDQLAALSTVQLSLTPTEGAKPVAEPGWHPWDTVRESARDLISVLRGGLELAIRVVIVFVPVLIVLWLVFRGLRWIWRRLRRRRAA
jgi:chemotaxis protein histidine kinase CheA